MSGFSEFERYDGVALAQLVQQSEVSSEELLEASVARIEARNPAVNAVVSPLYDEARAAIKAGLPAGPFTGVPYLLKDLGALYNGAITSCGSSAPGKKGAICSKLCSCVKYWIFGAKAGGSERMSFSRKIERSTKRRVMKKFLSGVPPAQLSIRFHRDQ